MVAEKDRRGLCCLGQGEGPQHFTWPDSSMQSLHPEHPTQKGGQLYELKQAQLRKPRRQEERRRVQGVKT